MPEAVFTSMVTLYSESSDVGARSRNVDSVTNFSLLYSFLLSGLCATGFFLLHLEGFFPWVLVPKSV